MDKIPLFYPLHLHKPNKITIFAPVISPRLGIISFGWGGCRHNKASKRDPDKTRLMGFPMRFVLGYSKSGKFH